MLIIFFLSLVPSIFSENVPHFICSDAQAVEFNKLCDGNEDCFDGGDEKVNICRHTICAVDQFRCYYGACISKILKCNGRKDCADGSDESQCGRENSCNASEYKCFSGQCIPNENICNNNPDCEDSSDEGEICKKMPVCPPSSHRCNIGGCIHLKQRCDGIKDCVDGSDESEVLCSVLNCKNENCHKRNISPVFCPPVNLQRITAHCFIYSGPHIGIIPCDKPVPPGTEIHYECKPFYIPATAKDKGNNVTYCQSDGTWNRELLRCIPDCGVRELDVAPLIVNGWVTTHEKFPWHAVLYLLEVGEWEFICGGTVLTERAVITAAHCVWETPLEMLQMAFGKHYSKFTRYENTALFRNISEIIMQPAYQDSVGNYESDIAILVLTEPLQFSESVRPICIDWNLNDITEHLSHNKLGLVVGMGITENDTFSARLRGAFLPIINESYCIQNQKKDFRKYITFTTFCAGWINGTAVCNGDSGGGLVFSSSEDANKYILQGIVSLSPRRLGTLFCDTSFYTVFTKIGMYVEWIYNTLKNFHDDVKFIDNVVF